MMNRVRYDIRNTRTNLFYACCNFRSPIWFPYPKKTIEIRHCLVGTTGTSQYVIGWIIFTIHINNFIIISVYHRLDYNNVMHLVSIKRDRGVRYGW